MANNEVKLRLSVDGTAAVVSDVDRVGDKLGTLDSRARQAAQGADTLKTALGAMATMGTVYAMVKMADAVTTLNTQLRLASGSAAEASSAYAALFDIAQKGRVSFTDLGTTYAAIARSGKEMGVSQARLLTVTQSISQAMTIGGGSAASMQAALVQLGQGLSSGVLRGEELNSVMEQTPRLAKALADGLGIPLGELRKLGEAGKLTSEQVINALEKAGPQLAKEMESATLTVGQAFTLLTNSATNFIGVADAASGASGTLAGALKAISGGIDAAGQSIKDNETAFKFITSGLAGAATAAGLGATAIGIGAVWAAVTLGGSAAVTAALAALGTVVGLAIAAGNELSHSEGIIKLSLAKINNEIEAAEKAKNYVLVTTLKERQALLEKELQDKQKKSTAIIGSVPSPDRAFEREAAKQDAKAQAELLGIRQKLSGVDANYLPTLERLNELRLAGTLGEKEYIALVSDLATKNYKKTASIKSVSAAKKELKDYDAHVLDFAKENLKTIGEEEKAREKYIATLNRSADSVGAHVQKLQDEEAALRLSAAQNISLAQALELVAIGRLHEEQAKQMSYGDDAAAGAIQTEIDKRRELIGLIGSKDAREANKKAVDELEKANQKAAEESEKFWTDALMRGFESGKGFFENFWDTIKNKIKTDVLRVMVQPVAQGITGMMGLSGAANAAGTANAASGIGALGSVAAGVSAFGGTLATGFMNTLVGSGMSGGLTAAGAMIANGAWASGLGMAAGALGPIGLGIAALSMIGNKDKSTANTGNASARYDSAGNRTDYQTYYGGSSEGVDKMLASLQTSYATTAKALGIAAAATQFSYGGNTGKNGESPNFALGGGAGSSRFYQGETASSDAAISLAASRAVFAALQGSDLPAYLAKVFNGVTADALSQDQINGTLAYAASLKQVRDALLETREPLQILKDNLAQGAQALGTSADTFKADFVTALDGGISPEKLAQWQGLKTVMDEVAIAAEKDAKTQEDAAKKISDSTAKEAAAATSWAQKLAVLQGTTTDRKLALEADLANATGIVTKAMISRVYALEDEKVATEAATEATKDLAATNKNWQDQLDVLKGKETDRSIALRDATDDSTRALMEQVYAQQDLKTAIDAAVTSQNSLVEKYKSPLNADTASQALGSDVVAMFAGKSADAIREMALNYAVSLDTQTEAGRAAVKQLAELAPAIDYFASAADKAATASANAAQALIDQRKALTDQLFDLTATDAEKAKRARDAIDQSNLDVYDKVIAAQLAVKTATESATAAAAAFAKQMQRFGSGLDLRFDLAGSGGANAPKAVATYLRDIVDAAITSTANFQAGFASGMFDQSSLITQATANTESRTNAALQATLRLRGFFEGMANDAAGIEKAIADSGTNIGKGVQALNVSQYFTDFAAELTAAVGEINRAMQDSAGTLADSATILAGVTSGSTGFVQGILDNLAGEMTSINASDLTALVQSVGGGATQIGAAITQSILNSVSASVKDNAAFAGLGGADLAYVSAVVSGVGQGDIQGINDAFLLLSGALTTGRIDATAYQEALNLVTTGFLTGADAATKIASAADILKQAGEFADRLAVANGTKTQLEISRKNELTTALDANNRATLLAIYAAEDLAAANTKAAEAARAAASNAMQGANDALSGLQRAVDAQKKLAQVQVDVASESVNNLKSIFDSLKGNIATLYGEVDSTSKYTANSGNAFITQALATAKATGYLPDAKDLGDAVSAAMAGASNTVYASQADADFAKLSLAGSLSGLKDISGTQLTAAEQTLKSAQDQLSVLDATYENAKLQLDAANNINTSVLSVADALRAFGVSLSAAQNAKVAQYVGTPTASVPRGSRSYIDAAAGTTQLAGNASPMATSELASSVVASWALGKNDPAIEDNVRRFMRDLELTPGALGISLPGFAQGINYVPHDMFARIHEGEAVVPKAYNPAAGGSSNARLEVLVEGLTKEVQRLQSIVNDGNAHNRRTADAVNGNPEMPMLVEQVV